MAAFPSLTEVEAAERSALQAYRRGFGGAPVYRASPGCERMCRRCDIACAILHGRAADLRAAYEANQLDPVLIFDTDTGFLMEAA